MKPELPLLVLADQHAELDRGCIETLTEEEREKLNDFLLKCHRSQKRKNRYPTVYADSAEIFRAKRRQREFALLQSTAPITEINKNAKVRKSKEQRKLNNDEQAATARADSSAVASPAKPPTPASLPDVELEEATNRHSLEKEIEEINAERQDEEQQQQQQEELVETPIPLENTTEENEKTEEEEGLNSTSPILQQPQEAAADTQEAAAAADELSESQQSVANLRSPSPERMKAKSIETSEETQIDLSCAVEPQEVNDVGEEEEEQGDEQTTDMIQTSLKSHIKRKQIKKEKREKKKQKKTEAKRKKEEKRKSKERRIAPPPHALASKEQNKKRAKTTISEPAREISVACEKKQKPEEIRKVVNPLKAARAAAAALQAKEREEEMIRLAACNGRRRSCVILYALQSQAKF